MMAIATTGEHAESMIVKGVVLRMTMAEAQAVLDVLERIGGDPKRSRRGLPEKVRDALCEINGLISCDDKGDMGSVEDLEGSLRFKDILS